MTHKPAEIVIFPKVRIDRWTEERPQTCTAQGPNVSAFGPAWHAARFEDLYSRGMALVEEFATFLEGNRKPRQMSMRVAIYDTALTTLLMNTAAGLLAIRGERPDEARKITKDMPSALKRLGDPPPGYEAFHSRSLMVAQQVLVALKQQERKPCASPSTF